MDNISSSPHSHNQIHIAYEVPPTGGPLFCRRPTSHNPRAADPRPPPIVGASGSESVERSGAPSGSGPRYRMACPPFSGGRAARAKGVVLPFSQLLSPVAKPESSIAKLATHFAISGITIAIFIPYNKARQGVIYGDRPKRIVPNNGPAGPVL